MRLFPDPQRCRMQTTRWQDGYRCTRLRTLVLPSLPPGVTRFIHLPSGPAFGAACTRSYPMSGRHGRPPSTVSIGISLRGCPRWTGGRSPVTDWEHVGDHALAGCHCRGQHLDRFFVSAALNHPLGCRQVLQDGIADLESLGLAACGFLEETALFLYRHRAKLTRFDLVRG